MPLNKLEVTILRNEICFLYFYIYTFIERIIQAEYNSRGAIMTILGVLAQIMDQDVRDITMIHHPEQFHNGKIHPLTPSHSHELSRYVSDRAMNHQPIDPRHLSYLWQLIYPQIFGSYTPQQRSNPVASYSAMRMTDFAITKLVTPVIRRADINSFFHPKYVECSQCNGRGGSRIRNCNQCHGHGVVIVHGRDIFPLQVIS